MYLRRGLHLQIRLYYLLPYKAKTSAQHGIGFILDRCTVYLGLTMPNLQKKPLLIFEIFNIIKCTLFLEPSILFGKIPKGKGNSRRIVPAYPPKQNKFDLVMQTSSARLKNEGLTCTSQSGHYDRLVAIFSPDESIFDLSFSC